MLANSFLLQGTNMLSRLLHVRDPTAKQAVITAIDLLGFYNLLSLWHLFYFLFYFLFNSLYYLSLPVNSHATYYSHVIP